MKLTKPPSREGGLFTGDQFDLIADADRRVKGHPIV